MPERKRRVEMIGNIPLSREELSCGQIGKCGSPLVPTRGHRRKEVVLAGAEKVVLDDGARRNDADDLPADERPGMPRVFDLVADRHPMPAVDEAPQVRVQRVVRDAAHRDPPALRHRPAGQGEL